MRNYESDAYRKYRSSMEQRQKVVRTSGSPYSQQTAVQGKRQIAERSASTKRKRTREKGKPYYDYDLLLVIIFLMCFISIPSFLKFLPISYTLSNPPTISLFKYNSVAILRYISISSVL